LNEKRRLTNILIRASLPANRGYKPEFSRDYEPPGLIASESVEKGTDSEIMYEY
jgi:hypothetical protein